MSARVYSGKAKYVQGPTKTRREDDATGLLFISQQNWESFTNKKTLFLQYRCVLGNGHVSAHTESALHLQ